MPDYTSNNNRLAKNSILLSIRMVIVMAISLYTTRVVLKILGVEEFGIYNVVCGFVALFGFLNTSMSNGIQRFFNYEYGNGEEGANKVFCTAVLIQLILGFIIILLTESIGVWYLHNKMVLPPERMFAAEWIFQLSILSFLFVIMQSPFTAAVMAHERMDFYAVVTLIDAILKLGIVFLLPHLRADQLIMYGMLMSGISIVNFIIYYAYCKSNFREVRLRRIFDKEMFRSMLGFSGWNLFGSFSGVMKEQGINLVLNFFFGPIVNAARGVAAQINNGMQNFVVNLTIPVRPQVVQSYAQGDLKRAMHLTYSISKLSCGFLLMMAIPASLEINYLLHLWLGDKVPEHAGTFAIIILATSIISNLSSATSGIVHATGIMRDYQIWCSLISMSAIPISYFLLTTYKIPEIALLCMFICATLGHTAGLFVVRRLTGMPLLEYFREVVWPLIVLLAVSLLFTYFAHRMMESGIIRLIVVTIVNVLCVSLTFYYYVLNKGERGFFLQLAKTIYKKVL